MIPREEIPESVRHAQHPLAHRHARQHVVDEAGRALRHAPAPAARAEATPFARERDEAFERALAAPQPGKAPLQYAAREKIPELLFDERRQPRPVGVVGRRVEEGFEVLVDHTIQDAVLGVSRSILGGDAETHGGEIGSARRRGQ